VLKKVYFGNQDIISNKIKKPSEYILANIELANIDKVDVKQHKIKKFLELEKIFYEWLICSIQRTHVYAQRTNRRRKMSF
jgi:hypothetical protein